MSGWRGYVTKELDSLSKSKLKLNLQILFVYLQSLNAKILAKRGVLKSIQDRLHIIVTEDRRADSFFGK